jgi:signal transduction histidine kinase
VVQTACVSLPPATASVVRETIRQLQGDLSDRAEELRMLMVAMRPPSFDDTDRAARVGDDALSAALRAYASELHGDTIGEVTPGVQIVVDPRLELDRSTMTIVYRIAQEALRNAVRHARATLVVVEVGVQEGRGAVFVEVTDDGIGFDRHTVDDGSGLSSMQLFTDLGRGELTVRSAPGEGTVVRSVLGVRDVTPSHHPRPGGDMPPYGGIAPDVGASPGRRDRRHLRLIPPVEVAPGP